MNRPRTSCKTLAPAAPADAPDADLSGYDFWLQKLDDHGGDFLSAEMARSFLVSAEYRSRFGQP